jgi:hypothetical protein
MKHDSRVATVQTTERVGAVGVVVATEGEALEGCP